MLKTKKPRTRTIPIRFDDDTSARIIRAAKLMGSNRSAVIRFAVINQIREIESGRINLNR